MNDPRDRDKDSSEMLEKDIDDIYSPDEDDPGEDDDGGDDDDKDDE